MAEKGLKIGDTFTEIIDEYSTRKYRIIGFDNEGRYISQAIDKETVNTPKIEEIKPIENVVEEVEKPKYTKTAINRMSTAELKKVCKEVGIKPKDTGAEMKKDLLAKFNL